MTIKFYVFQRKLFYVSIYTQENKGIYVFVSL